MILKHKIVVITGASDGIGQALAVRLSKEGARMALIGRDQERLNKTVEQCRSSAKAYVCDVRDRAAIKQAVDAIAQEFGAIDALVNNAGVWQKLADLDEIDDELITEQLEANLAGTIFMTKYCLPHLRKRSEAAVINVISKSGVAAQEGQSVYTATKYGTRGFTDVLRADLKDTNVHVGAIYQAGTNTQMFAKTGDDFPLEKFTEPADLADAITYMLTRPPKMWITELHVNYQ